MSWQRKFGLGLLILGLAVSCVPKIPTKPVSMPIDSGDGFNKNNGGGDPRQESEVRFLLPEKWRSMAPSGSRMEFLGPDNRSRIYVKAVLSKKAVGDCSALARRTADEVISSWGKGPRTKLLNRIQSKSEVEFELRRSDPGPWGEVLWYRLICQNPVVVIASCAVPSPKKDKMKSSCTAFLESVELVPALADSHNPGAKRAKN